MPIEQMWQGLSVHGDRLIGRLRRLAAIGGDGRGGVTRLGFTEEDRQGRDYIAEQARQAGLMARVDPAGNLIIHRHETSSRPVLMMGSHLDTVVRGGALDGAYGVVGAMEVLETCKEYGVALDYEPVVVAFANEEGGRFPCPFWGSKAITGQLRHAPDSFVDRDGVSLETALREMGGDPRQLTEARWPSGSIAAYIELHIEQGPVLERTGATIGVVEAIFGRTVVEIEVSGRAGHAGTTPMKGRSDALAAAARIALVVESMARDDGTCAVATVGQLLIEPGATNVIPGSARLTVEMRDSNVERLAAAESCLIQRCADIARHTSTRVEARVLDRFMPIDADTELRALISASADDVGVPWLNLPSGAGHDAQIMASAAPIGMIFVPSVGGVSHVPEERTADVDLVTGAQVLLTTVLHMGGRREIFDAAARRPVTAEALR
jgi:beta-ureidopropionase / N-carbamoyl-L-amino-acid hydrolase